MILALETATTACSAALCAADGSVVAERLALAGPAHSQLLLPFVREVLEEAGAGWEAVGTVAVGLGPGAFTGLRIGIATARALAQADGRAGLAGVPTLAAVALALAGAPEAAGRKLVPLIDGRRREVFAAVFEQDGDGVRQTEDVAVVRADDLTAWLGAHGDVLTGADGAVLYRDLLPASALQASAVVTPTAAMVGRAVACGAPGLVRGPDAVLPLYGRAPDAKPRAADPDPVGSDPADADPARSGPASSAAGGPA
jgi:tRNA threonylcarbamoyladenosine biosynthesis protein TsaB